MPRDGCRLLTLLCAWAVCASVAIPVRIDAAEKFRPFKLKALDGTERSLADVQGKATLIVFFFPTCRYCNAAFPSMQELHDAYKDRGLSMVWINVIPEEDRLIRDWLANNGYTVPVLLGGRSTQNAYRLTTTPTHYLIDERGQVLSRQAGFKPGDEIALERAIDAALTASRSAPTTPPAPPAAAARHSSTF
jgi:peroxiredoxin